MSKAGKRSNKPPLPVPKPTQPNNSHTIAASYQGPLPPPAMFKQYDDILPGAAERILHLFESQSEHRQAIEKAVITSDIEDGRLGLHLGAAISALAIIAGAVCILYGHPTTGGIIAAIPVPTLAAVFVYGSRQRRKEREGRR
jgi:uncharacterized membrane protein